MGRPARLLMYLLISGGWCSNYLIRNSLPSLLPFVAKAQGFSDAQLATLLGAFYPGYLLTQIPAGILATRVGAKIVLTSNMAATAILTLAMPSIARRGVVPLAALLSTMGLFQGSLVPAGSLLQKDWLEGLGAQRPLIEQLMSVLGLIGGNVAASALTPRIASGPGGWQRVCLLYGGGTAVFTVIWQLLAANKPPPSSAASSAMGSSSTAAVEEQSGQRSKSDSEETKSTGVDWRVFSCASVWAVMVAQVACNNQNNTIRQWGPTYFTDILGSTPAMAGSYMATSGVVNFLAGFATAAVETAMLAAKIPVLTIRKIMVALNAVGNSVCLLGFGAARTPLQGAAAFTAAEVFTATAAAGYNPNYREVGGDDTAVVAALGNTMANVTGMTVPILGVYLRRISGGSWVPLFVAATAVNLLSAGFFTATASDKPARETLTKRD